MRVLGTFVNFGSASERLNWDGHAIRAVWRERRPGGFGWDRWHRHQHHEPKGVAAPVKTVPCAR